MCIIIASAKFTNHGLQLIIWPIGKFREGAKKWMAHVMFIRQVFNTALLIKLYVLHQLTQSLANLMKHLRIPIKKYTQKSDQVSFTSVKVRPLTAESLNRSG
jgi:hypothetical protein